MKSFSQLHEEGQALYRALVAGDDDAAMSLMNNSDVINLGLDSEKNTALVLSSTVMPNPKIVDFIIKHKKFKYAQRLQLKKALKGAMPLCMPNVIPYEKIVLSLLSHEYFHSPYGSLTSTSPLSGFDIAMSDVSNWYIAQAWLMRNYKEIENPNQIKILFRQYDIAIGFLSLGAQDSACKWQYLAISTAAEIATSSKKTLLSFIHSEDVRRRDTAVMILKLTVTYYLAGQHEGMPYKITSLDAFNAAMALGMRYLGNSINRNNHPHFLDADRIASQDNSLQQHPDVAEKLPFIKILIKYYKNFEKPLSISEELDLLYELIPLLQACSKEARAYFNWIHKHSEKVHPIYIISKNLILLSQQEDSTEFLALHHPEIFAFDSFYGLDSPADLNKATTEFEEIAEIHKQAKRSHQSFSAYLMSLIAQQKILKSLLNTPDPDQQAITNIIETATQTCVAMLTVYSIHDTHAYANEMVVLMFEFINAAKEPSHQIILFKCVLQLYHIFANNIAKYRDFTQQFLENIQARILSNNDFLSTNIHILLKTISDNIENNSDNDLKYIKLKFLTALIKHVDETERNASVEFSLRESFITIISDLKITCPHEQITLLQDNLDKMINLTVKYPIFNAVPACIKLANMHNDSHEKFALYVKAVHLRNPKAALAICLHYPDNNIDINRVITILHQALKIALFPIDAEVITTINNWIIRNKNQFMTNDLDIEEFKQLELLAILANQYQKGNLEAIALNHHFLPALIKLVNDQIENAITDKTLDLCAHLLFEVTLYANFHRIRHGLKNEDIQKIAAKPFNFLSMAAYNSENPPYKKLATDYMNLYTIAKNLASGKTAITAEDTNILINCANNDAFTVLEKYIADNKMQRPQDGLIPKSSITHAIIEWRQEQVLAAEKLEQRLLTMDTENGSELQARETPRLSETPTLFNRTSSSTTDTTIQHQASTFTPD